MKYTVAEFRAKTREILNAVDQGADVQIERYGKLYRVSAAENGTFVVDRTMGIMDEAAIEPDPKVVKHLTRNVKPPQKNKSVEQAQKRIDTATEKLAEEGLEKLKKIPKGVAPVEACPHGFAKGFCKKAECNRKYQQ